jgi:signal transduction histidine kinase
MKNNVTYKRYLIISVIFSFICLITFILFNIYSYKTYSYYYNKKLNDVVSNVKEIYPETKEEDLVKIILKDSDSNILDKYFSKDKSYLKINNKKFSINLILCILIFISPLCILFIIFTIYNYKKEKEINGIINIIKEINKKNYNLKIDELSEDELSILKNEIYKTMINLKEVSEYNKSQRKELKDSLEDISHQIKTPLTSILILIDNILDNKDMDEETRIEFITDIKKEIITINFLVQNILKLSKFESNTIEFNNKNTDLKELVKESIKNLELISDLKSININLKGNIKDNINIDPIWQKEAITNIIKNAIEHSKNASNVDIFLDENNVYSSVTIVNYGETMDCNDMKHIFERFYKSKNSNKDSIGIGLPLAKTIIEKNNGTISVESLNNETKFIIKYFKI